MTKLISLILILCITTSHKVEPTQTKPSKSDSTITFNDLNEFNAYLRDTRSFTYYSKLTPDMVLGELWNWKLQKLNALKKQTTDTTTKKK